MSVYVDAMGNIGPLSRMVKYPIMRLVGIWSSLEQGINERKVKDASCNMVMVSGKGFMPEPGYYYSIIVNIQPATAVKGFTFNGPLCDVVGNITPTASQNAFCFNPELKYKITSSTPVAQLVIRTKVISHLNVMPLWFKVNFDASDPLDRNLELPSLGDFLSMNPDFKIVIKNSGFVLDVCKAVISRAGAFRTMLSFKENIDPNSSDRVVMETDKYHDDVWKSAYFFMLHTRLSGDDIETLIKLYEFGDEFIVPGLCPYVVQTLRARVDDGVFVGLNPYLIPLLHMSVFWQTRDGIDSELVLRLRELTPDCEISACNHSHTVMRHCPDFMEAWARYLRYKEAWLGPIPPLERDPVHMLGPMEWPMPDRRKRIKTAGACCL